MKKETPYNTQRLNQVKNRLLPWLGVKKHGEPPGGWAPNEPIAYNNGIGMAG
jgi:hypothetical protein